MDIPGPAPPLTMGVLGENHELLQALSNPEKGVENDADT